MTLLLFFELSVNVQANDFSSVILPESNADQNYVEGEVIVKYKDKLIDLEKKQGRVSADKIDQKHDLEKIDVIPENNLRLLKSDDESTEKLIQQLENDPAIEFAEPNFRKTPSSTTNDAFFSSQWGLNNTGQLVQGVNGTLDADIDAPEAWDLEQTGITNDALVAVIDTGVRYDHEDLAANMWNGAGCKDDLNVTIPGGCPKHGWNYADNNDDPMDVDLPGEPGTGGHGSHLAGIIGATSNNGTGISGISHFNHLKIMAVRFGFDTISEIKAINFAKNNGAKVINASFVGDNYSQAEKNAIDGFNGLLITAAGNGGNDSVSDNNESTPVYPCNYSSANIICVTATNSSDQLASFGNYGTTSVDLAAPGKDLLSTYNTSNASYVFMSGTSMATPITVGTAGLIYAKNPTLSIQSVKNILINSGDYKSQLADKTVSGRRLNLQNALAMFSDATAPVRANGSPINGSFSSDTSQITLSLSTDEVATCRYSNNSGNNYSSMNQFSTTGNLSHATTISGLTNGNNYAYYIKCQDTMGNTNADDYTLSFSIAAVIQNPPAPIYYDTILNNKYTLNIYRRFSSKTKRVNFYGSVSNGDNIRVRVYRGRNNRYEFKGETGIEADTSWRLSVNTKKKGSYFFKFVYVDDAGTELRTDGPFYIKLGIKKK